MDTTRPIKCKECQFESSRFMTVDYVPHAPGCSMAKPPLGMGEIEHKFKIDTINRIKKMSTIKEIDSFENVFMQFDRPQRERDWEFEVMRTLQEQRDMILK